MSGPSKADALARLKASRQKKNEPSALAQQPQQQPQQYPPQQPMYYPQQQQQQFPQYGYSQPQPVYQQPPPQQQSYYPMNGVNSQHGYYGSQPGGVILVPNSSPSANSSPQVGSRFFAGGQPPPQPMAPLYQPQQGPSRPSFDRGEDLPRQKPKVNMVNATPPVPNFINNHPSFVNISRTPSVDSLSRGSSPAGSQSSVVRNMNNFNLGPGGGSNSGFSSHAPSPAASDGYSSSVAFNPRSVGLPPAAQSPPTAAAPPLSKERIERIAQVHQNVSMSRVLQVINEQHNDVPSIMKILNAENKGGARGGGGQPSSSTPSSSVHRQQPQQFQYQPPQMPQQQQFPAYNPALYQQGVPMGYQYQMPPQPSPPINSQRSKNAERAQKSSIYANRKSGEGLARPPAAKKAKRNDSDVSSDDEDGIRGGDMNMQRAEWDEDKEEEDALNWFNTCDAQQLLDLTACTADQAAAIVDIRPFKSVADLRTKMGKKKGVSARLFDNYIEIMEGYHKVDSVLEQCELVGDKLNRAMGALTKQADPGTNPNDAAGALHMVSVHLDIEKELAEEQDPDRKFALKNFISTQPSLLAEGITLKDYQLLGLNWLNLLYKKGLSCILADEMGLGKTIQVISFLAHLKATDAPDVAHRPHLIIVPSSTLENWVREFSRFAPTLEVQTYYGSAAERRDLQLDLFDLLDSDQLDVIVTTYNLAAGTNKEDRSFLKKMKFRTAIFDEGHQLKNYKSARYSTLMNMKVGWRLLLTGTPLQNNLQELVSVLNFILPEYFTDAEDAMRSIFKVGADSHANLLSRQRVSRAQKMMTPFVLRRRKNQVLKDLPKKIETLRWCDMTPAQAKVYRQSEMRSRRALLAAAATEEPEPPKKKGRKRARDVAEELEISVPETKKVTGETFGSNVLMELRKAANHPLLFRLHYTDAKLKVLAKDCMKEPDFMASEYNLIVEDLSVMTDAEIHFFCKRYKAVRHHMLSPEVFLDSGKIAALKSILDDCLANDKRLLLFSMFTQVLDILQTYLDDINIRWVLLTGSTPVDERQALVDEFTEDKTITVFLLSTLAGGMGINLTAANVVCIFDQGFNPHNEKQAADRAYRIGQTKDVEVITLLSKGTIDEDILELGGSKLKLDAAVSGQDITVVADALKDDAVEEGGDEAKIEGTAKSNLLDKLRAKFKTKLDTEAADEAAAEAGASGIITPDEKEEEGVKAEAQPKAEEAVEKPAEEIPNLQPRSRKGKAATTTTTPEVETGENAQSSQMKDIADTINSGETPAKNPRSKPALAADVAPFKAEESIKKEEAVKAEEAEQPVGVEEAVLPTDSTPVAESSDSTADAPIAKSEMDGVVETQVD